MDSGTAGAGAAPILETIALLNHIIQLYWPTVDAYFVAGEVNLTTQFRQA